MSALQLLSILVAALNGPDQGSASYGPWIGSSPRSDFIQPTKPGHQQQRNSRLRTPRDIGSNSAVGEIVGGWQQHHNGHMPKRAYPCATSVSFVWPLSSGRLQVHNNAGKCSLERHSCWRDRGGQLGWERVSLHLLSAAGGWQKPAFDGRLGVIVLAESRGVACSRASPRMDGFVA